MSISGNWIDSSRAPDLYPGTAIRWGDAPPLSSVELALNAFVRYKEGLSSAEDIPTPSVGKNSVDVFWLGYFDLDPNDSTIYSRSASTIWTEFPLEGTDPLVPRIVYAGGGDIRLGFAARVRLAAVDDPNLDPSAGVNAWYVYVIRVPVPSGNEPLRRFYGLRGFMYNHKPQIENSLVGGPGVGSFVRNLRTIFPNEDFANNGVNDEGKCLYFATRKAVVNGIQTVIADPYIGSFSINSSSAQLVGTSPTFFNWKMEVVMPLAHELIEPVGTPFVPAPKYQILQAPPPVETFEGDSRPGDWGWDLAR